MNAVQLLRTMHAESKMRFKIILAADDPAQAAQEWDALQPVLKLHEQLEDQFLYAPLHAEMPAGTPLGDWEVQHQRDVDLVSQLIESSKQLDAGTPAWQMCIARIMDALQKHITDEEGQIFPRIEQMMGPERLDQAAQQMQQLVEVEGQAPRRKAAARRKA